ncbi:BnaC09g47590D [Brassica napus]|uniref:BnaC09g47590D protein n=1 Tax=Brassica napus TaxID=3708 RepID=A0A078GA13_BRANA|nr:BnaC09g47590D [Brassica napus]
MPWTQLCLPRRRVLQCWVLCLTGVLLLTMETWNLRKQLQRSL